MINALCRDQELDGAIAHANAFSDAGAHSSACWPPASPDAICASSCALRPTGGFGTLYALSDLGLDAGEDAGTLYEELLMADPSGMEGRPGSADTS